MLLENKKDGNMSFFRWVLLTLLICKNVLAAEVITLYSPYPPGYTLDPVLFEVVALINSQQNQFVFVLDRKPGGNTILALKALANKKDSSLALIGPPVVDHIQKGTVEESDYVPLVSFGDACWSVVGTVGHESIKSLKEESQELVWGTGGIGGGSHITGLLVSRSINRPIRFIHFKSAADANMVLISNSGLNLSLMSLKNYENFKVKNNNLQLLAITCATSHPRARDVKTLSEQGINAPTVFNTVVAHKDFDSEKAHTISTLLHKAIGTIGAARVMELSEFQPPQFQGLSTVNYHTRKIKELLHYNNLFKDQINESKQ